MLQADEPDTFVLATDRTETVCDFVSMAFKAVDITINWNGKDEAKQGTCAETGKVLVSVNPKLYRPTEVDLLIGNPLKAKEVQGCEPKTPREQLCRMMVEADMRRNENGFSVL